MPNLKNCVCCGKFYEPVGIQEMCITCAERDEKDFRRIREYLIIHPFAKIFDVASNLNISISQIKRYLREDRIEIVEKNNRFLKCEICGIPICSGIYCNECFKGVKHAGSKPLIGSSIGRNQTDKKNPEKLRSGINYKGAGLK